MGSDEMKSYWSTRTEARSLREFEKPLAVPIRGIVKSVDIVDRDMTVQLQNGPAVFDVPPDCPIVLHGETVKFRMVQPGDRVWITFHSTADRLVADKLEIQAKPGFRLEKT